MNEEVTNIFTKFCELLAKSEERIDKTNEMISKCVLMMNTVTTEYVKQLDKVQEARDKVINQNSELIKIVERCQEDKMETQKRYDALLDKMLMYMNTHKADNNITVK